MDASGAVCRSGSATGHYLHAYEPLVEERCDGPGLREAAAGADRAHKIEAIALDSTRGYCPFVISIDYESAEAMSRRNLQLVAEELDLLLYFRQLLAVANSRRLPISEADRVVAGLHSRRA
jgi:hypothetical protein